MKTLISHLFRPHFRVSVPLPPFCRPSRVRRIALLALLAAGWFSALPPGARAEDTATLTTIHSFSGSDGNEPNPGLVEGNDGNFYGTTVRGGVGLGTVFQITPAGAFKSLYSFTGGSDGANPRAGLILGRDGNFYGTTTAGPGSGTVFQITPAGTLTTLAIIPFIPFQSDGSPEGPLVQGNDGSFYGTRMGDGLTGPGPMGELFRLSPANVYTTLATFGSENPTGLVLGTGGNLYVTTAIQGDGAILEGTVYGFTTAGEQTLVYYFPDGFNDPSGEAPVGALVQLPSNGNFYGVLYGEGPPSVFEITSTGVVTTIYTDVSPDGFTAPNSPLTLGKDGNFYGTDGVGYDNAPNGFVYQITLAGVFTKLHTFTNTGDGFSPTGKLLQGSDGNFYGTTYSSRDPNGDGTIFKLVVIPLPELSVTAVTRELDVNTGAVGHFRVRRKGGDLSQPLTVAYELSGDAQPGVDYRTKRGFKVIPAGRKGTRIYITPKGDLDGKSSQNIRLTLLPGTGFTLGRNVSAVMRLEND